jgi:cytidylate kinase
MSQPADLDAFTDSSTPGAPRHGFQGDRGRPPAVRHAPLALTIALSREAGARGTSIARRAGLRLGWQVYDQELLEYMSQDAAARQEIVENLPAACLDWMAHRNADLRQTCGVDEQSAVYPLAQTVLALAARGEAVLIGRGAGYILPRESTLNVRILAPLADRIAYTGQWLRLTTAEATARVTSRDERRADFLRVHFGRTPAEVHQYELLLNSTSLGEENCAELIAKAAQLRWGGE